MASMHYRLDDLGWYHFEKLVQALLKIKIGVSVEAVGGLGDFGRDAYCPGPLRYPDESFEKEGPFVFQVKFVANANASGARPWPQVWKAIRAETKRIRERSVLAPKRRPSVYTLLTNARVGEGNRERIRQALGDVIGGCDVLIMDGIDISALLDGVPEIRRSFPELLSIRDLDSMLEAAVNKDLLERSKAAVDEAREVVRVFVPTNAYDVARRKLAEFGFVVLDGPPEMGKTAIARVLSIIRLSDGWQIVECFHPDHFFRAYNKRVRQFFVVDDAFGRTEFDVTLGRAWERQLGHVMHRLDTHHWMIFTARKHILQRALKTMDLLGEASNFPNPAEVTVDTKLLTLEEKARMLYRHAKLACGSDRSREVVREYARMIVNHKHFTPERIRRFVSEDLPRLSGQGIDAVEKAISVAIQDPTSRMRKSFDSLSAEHRWVLVVMLNFSFRATVDGLVDQYRASRSDMTAKGVWRCVEDLDGSFLAVYRASGRRGEWRVEWLHPSYRDLVIERLSVDGRAQVEFLRCASLDGLRLVFSSRGEEDGASGLPLLGTDESWQWAHQRSLQFVPEGEFTAAPLLLVQLNTYKQSAGREKLLLKKVIEAVWLALCEMAATGGVASGETVDLVCNVALALGREPDIDIARVWEEASKNLEFELGDSFGSYGYLEDWFLLCATIEEFFGEYAASLSFHSRRTEIFVRIEAKIEEELEDNYVTPGSSEAERLRAVADALASPVATIFRKEELDQWSADLEAKAAIVEEIQQQSSRSDWAEVYEFGAQRRSQAEDQQTIWDMFQDL